MWPTYALLVYRKLVCKSCDLHSHSDWLDPEREEKYQDGMLRARERMQRTQDEKAREHSVKEEEVCFVICNYIHE